MWSSSFDILDSVYQLTRVCAALGGEAVFDAMRRCGGMMIESR